jgi:peptidyl-prolyl cis-trans isomerase A (cyclophilin A)
MSRSFGRIAAMSKNRIVAGLAALLFSVVANAAAPERVLVTTNMGPFIIELQRDRAPLTVENFLTYVKSGHYTNTLFHRVVANFLIQGGGVGPDYKGKPTLKPIPNESGNGLKNLRGTVGLARASAHRARTAATASSSSTWRITGTSTHCPLAGAMPCSDA